MKSSQEKYLYSSYFQSYIIIFELGIDISFGDWGISAYISFATEINGIGNTNVWLYNLIKIKVNLKLEHYTHL